MKSNLEWQYWGSTDPLLGVSSVRGKGKHSREPWTDEEFYSRSQPEWAQFLEEWQLYGLNPAACVEIGCGVGRMTMLLEKHFSRVHACDVSTAMIEYARKACNPAIVSFHLTDGLSIPLPDGSVTAGFSTIVFQHFHDPKEGMRYFHELFRVMAPGATFMINVPLYKLPNGPAGWLLPLSYGIVVALSNARAAFKRMILSMGPTVMKTRVGRALGSYMHFTRYEFSWLYSSLLEIGFQDIRVWTLYVPTEKCCHDFVFARKL
jgi:ubiquinone/menaquinone biosynthesis C-methylase UbiE